MKARKTLSLQIVALAIAGALQQAAAQMPGQPVLQNAFANHGWAFGVNYGGSAVASSYAVAGSWGSGSGRLALAAGGGLYDPDAGQNAFAWGTRGLFSIVQFASRKSVGIGVFAGVGGASRSGIDLIEIPLGASLAYRRSLGASCGVSVYASPFFRLSRISGSGESERGTTFRFSAGLDVALFPKLGLTVGFEGGAKADPGKPGPEGGIFGVGVSYVPR